MAKEKKIELRDIVYEMLASAIMQDNHNLQEIRKHKEGLEFNINGEVFAVRVVKKKAKLTEDGFIGVYFHDEKEQAFGFRSLK